MQSIMFTNSAFAALSGLLAIYLTYTLYTILTSPLRNVPGPFVARFTKLWYLAHVRRGRFEQENIALHRRYGPIVRIAPDHYSLDHPDAVRAVYGLGAKSFPKSDWYFAWQHPDPDRFTLFPDRNIHRHAETRRRFQALYSMTSLVSYEPFVDACGDLFARRIGEVAEAAEAEAKAATTKGASHTGDSSRAVMEMSHWFQCYAFDVVASITYGRRFGFLDRGEDVNGTIAALDRTLLYGTLVGIFPRLHPFLFKLGSRFSWSGAQGRLYLMDFVQKQITRRKKERVDRKMGVQQQEEEGENEINEVPEATAKDFLDKMMDQNEADPEKVTPYHVFMMGLSNVIAGSDTTAASLSAVLYYLLRYPRTLRKLKAEIREFTERGWLSARPTFAESQKMPYFQAAMKEALRMHAATGLPMWRVVPAEGGGTVIADRFFPAGTVVGINTWTAHRNREVFGDDADEFRPERWLEAEEEAKLEGGEGATKERLRRMDGYYMPFGLGSRTCIGRHISILEMSKLLPRLLRDFDFELERPEWKTENVWFVKPNSFFVRVRPAGAGGIEKGRKRVGEEGDMVDTELVTE